MDIEVGERRSAMQQGRFGSAGWQTRRKVEVDGEDRGLMALQVCLYIKHPGLMVRAWHKAP